MTLDLIAGLLIGSFAIYACWLLSLRLAEPEPPADWHPDPVGDALIFLDEAFSDDR